jgi:hypothetical protein
VGAAASYRGRRTPHLQAQCVPSATHQHARLHACLQWLSTLATQRLRARSVHKALVRPEIVLVAAETRHCSAKPRQLPRQTCRRSPTAMGALPPVRT